MKYQAMKSEGPACIKLYIMINSVNTIHWLITLNYTHLWKNFNEVYIYLVQL